MSYLARGPAHCKGIDGKAITASRRRCEQHDNPDGSEAAP